MAKDLIFGLMEDNMKVNGGMESCMEMEFICERMGESIKDSIIMIKNMDKVCIYGLMANHILEDGKMDVSMALE